MKLLLIILSFFIQLSLQAQKIFSENDLIAVVKKYHPIARQALLDVEIAEAQILVRRGLFDPRASYGNSRKNFDGTEYYNQQSTELKIPVWYGIELHAGTENLGGSRLNPEETSGTINYVGVSIPVLNFTDLRRATLQQAKLYKRQEEFAARSTLNTLVADALTAYLKWWEKFEVYKTVQSSLQNAQLRLRMVKTLYELGERPAIDTLETVTQVLYLEQLETESKMLLQQSRLELSIHLWEEENRPYILPEDAVPQKFENYQPPGLDSLFLIARQHPIVKELSVKREELKLEKKIQFQSLLPDVSLKYNNISRNFSNVFHSPFFENNYQFGFQISVPLRLSEGRGKFRIARLKIEKIKLDQEYEQVRIQNSISQYYNEWQQTNIQFQQQVELVKNYLALQKGEETRFKNGESSIFMINSREAKLIEGRQKQLSFASKTRQAQIKLMWAAGMFGEF